MSKKLLFFLTSVVILSLLFAGCSGSQSSSGNTSSSNTSNTSSNSSGKKDNTLTVAVDENFISMDPHDTNDTLSFSAQKTMYQGLFGFNKSMEVVPILAKDYKVSKDGTVYTINLKKEIQFQDGAPFNAKAVKVNIDRLANPENHLKRHSLYAMVKATKVVDDDTVKIILKQPFGAFINNLAHPAGMMISPKALKKWGKKVSKHPVGTGPFKFKEWIPGDHLTVVKNKNYWEKGYPKIDQITFKPVPENGSRTAMLKTGEADFIYPVPPEQAKQIDGKNGITVQAKPSIIVQYLSMNTMKKPFNDPKVRKAINYAINKKAYIKVVNNGFGKILDSVIAPKTQYYSKQQVYKYNPQKAKQLLKEAGYPNGFSTSVWGENNSTTMKGMQFLQQQLSKVGIKVKIVPMESGTMSSKIWGVQSPQKAKVELYYGGWSPSTGDADWGIRPLLSGTAFPPNAYNTAYYNNPKVTKLINKAMRTSDPNQRKTLYSKIQKMIWNDAPWAFLTVEDTLAGKKDYVKGVYLLPDGSLSTHDAEIAK
ncbi:MAG TPA: glutathione ABC transporter substrate-binding protein [Bacillales bacterium]|nr:glutathione ABC transporter substrate-binding protein [Bacillales bacterium]